MRAIAVVAWLAVVTGCASTVAAEGPTPTTPAADDSYALTVGERRTLPFTNLTAYAITSGTDVFAIEPDEAGRVVVRATRAGQGSFMLSDADGHERRFEVNVYNRVCSYPP